MLSPCSLPWLLTLSCATHNVLVLSAKQIPACPGSLRLPGERELRWDSSSSPRQSSSFVSIFLSFLPVCVSHFVCLNACHLYGWGSSWKSRKPVSGSLQFLASAGAHKSKENTCRLSISSVSDLILCKLISRLNKPNIWYSQDGPGCIIPNFMYEETETQTYTVACVGAESGFWTKAVWCEWDSVLWDDCLVTDWLNDWITLDSSRWEDCYWVNLASIYGLDPGLNEKKEVTKHRNSSLWFWGCNVASWSCWRAFLTMMKYILKLFFYDSDSFLGIWSQQWGKLRTHPLSWNMAGVRLALLQSCFMTTLGVDSVWRMLSPRNNIHFFSKWKNTSPTWSSFLPLSFPFLLSL